MDQRKIIIFDNNYSENGGLSKGVRPAVPSVESNIYKVAGNCYEETRYEKSSLQRCRTDSVRIRTSKSNTDLR